MVWLNKCFQIPENSCLGKVSFISGLLGNMILGLSCGELWSFLLEILEVFPQWLLYIGMMPQHHWPDPRPRNIPSPSHTPKTKAQVLPFLTKVPARSHAGGVQQWSGTKLWLWTILVYLGLPWFTLVYLGLPWFILVYLGLSWFTLVYLGFIFL